ncbi:hypothetical protein Pla110_13020 [Polystyrenella longa]|uniref:Uncharacterized protein n=1 Tax=Polystyrenella longa TaxID=2528007 RepID=A0A518CK42_9PLAN|nr:hypothetical protein [Polystyrenella longa]QDU79591.1 hypothetical protein Pla110_13020 [Polystyrenella longa]
MFNGLEHVALGGFILLAAYIIQRRTWRKRSSRNRSNAYAESQREIIALDNAQRNELNRLHVKLHDFERMVDAKVQTRVLQLEQLLELADQEIQRLNGEVARIQAPTKTDSPPVDRFTELMEDAGFSKTEATHLADLPESLKKAG